MLKDIPSEALLNNLKAVMYQKHPIRLNVAGALETIQQITPELLYKVYDAFYNPHNMVLAVTGNVSPDEILELCDRLLLQKEKPSIERIIPKDEGIASSRYIEQRCDLFMPEFMLGFKDASKELTPMEHLSSRLSLSSAFGKGSELYQELKYKTLINSSFKSSFLSIDKEHISIFKGQTSSPEKLRDEIISEIERVKLNGIDAQSFECARRKEYAWCVSAFSSLDEIADALIEAMLYNKGALLTWNHVFNISIDEVNARFKEQFISDNSVLSVLRR